MPIDDSIPRPNWPMKARKDRCQMELPPNKEVKCNFFDHLRSQTGLSCWRRGHMQIRRTFP